MNLLNMGWDDLMEHPFILTTDFSGQAMGFVLSQHQDGHERLIAAGGKKCNAAESASGGEMEELVYGVTKFDPYLSLNNFIIRTDNQSLQYLTKLKHTNNIWSRWLQHVPGKENKVANTISREPRLFGEEEEPHMRDQEVFNQLAGDINVLVPGEGL